MAAITSEMAYGAANSYTEQSLVGMGALKGAAAKIYSITDNPDSSHTIVFQWEDNDGKEHYSSLTIKDGEHGHSPIIKENEKNTDDIYRLDIETAEGTKTTRNLIGKQGARGEKGDNGFSPIITVEENSENVYRIKIVTEYGEYITPNLKGTGTATGDYDDLTDKPKINGIELSGDKSADDLGIRSSVYEITGETLVIK